VEITIARSGHHLGNAHATALQLSTHPHGAVASTSAGYPHTCTPRTPLRLISTSSIQRSLTALHRAHTCGCHGNPTPLRRLAHTTPADASSHRTESAAHPTLPIAPLLLPLSLCPQLSRRRLRHPSRAPAPRTAAHARTGGVCGSPYTGRHRACVPYERHRARSHPRRQAQPRSTPSCISLAQHLPESCLRTWGWPGPCLSTRRCRRGAAGLLEGGRSCVVARPREMTSPPR